MADISFSKNNFDLIRLMAALQVAFCHSVEMLSPAYAKSDWMQFLQLFPGVPIFFIISGFLISRSYEKGSQLSTYVPNRVLRIFPGLYLCLILNIILIWMTGYFGSTGVQFSEVLLLFLAKATIFQFYNPDFMRGFGDGVLNGSLWTICVELQFYVLIPILYRFIVPGQRTRNNSILVGLLVASLLCNRYLYGAQQEYLHSVYWKLLRVSFLPWFYMFLIGVILQRNFESIKRFINPKLFPVVFLGYTAYAALMHSSGFQFNNSISPLLTFPASILIVFCAYTQPTLADRLLHRNDVSYGLYIYHMVIVNLLLYYGFKGPLIYPSMAVLGAILLGYLSWTFIEKPCLSRKRQTLHMVSSGPIDAKPY